MVEEARAVMMKFGVCQKTIGELFDLISKGELDIDPSPVDVRNRTIELANLMTMILFEKSVSTCAHGRGQVALWNNLVEAIKMQMNTCEIVHQSFCSEAKVTKYL
jgi:hypothetical protein